ncbi:hypothetical protein F5883DRAFT_36729 [Diaporthe sp. PMI_573]|nr:hypothetical protein F5883DRAFT_36729 [Diaporthaceae sp. PMI_573]
MRRVLRVDALPLSIPGCMGLYTPTPYTHTLVLTLQGRPQLSGFPGRLHGFPTGCRLRQAPRRKSNRSSEITPSLLSCESGFDVNRHD